MDKWFGTSMDALLAIILTTIGIYVAVVVYTRIFGKRSFTKVTSFDFAMTVAIGSIVATTILSKSVSLAQGATGLFTVYLLQLMTAYLRRWPAFNNMISNEPMLLMDGTEVLWENLKKSRVTEGDLRSKLREANVLDLNQVRAVVFETTGDILVLHTSDPDMEVQSWIMEDVKKE